MIIEKMISKRRPNPLLPHFQGSFFFFFFFGVYLFSFLSPFSYYYYIIGFGGTFSDFFLYIRRREEISSKDNHLEGGSPRGVE